MSAAVWLAVLGALLPFVGGLFSTAAQARRWRAAAGLAAALVAVTVWFTAPPVGQIGHPITAEATDAAGAPVSTVVVLQRDGGRRQVRRLPLRSPVSNAEYVLWAAIALGLLGGALQLRDDDLGHPLVAPALSLAGIGAAAAAFASSAGAASGEAGVRAYLAGFDTSAVKSFTVPDLPWSAQPDGTLALVVAAAVAGLALISAVMPRVLDRRWRLWLSPSRGALIASVAVIWRMVEVGGLPWRGVEGALWAAAIILALAGFERASALRRSTLVAAALTLALAALGA